MEYSEDLKQIDFLSASFFANVTTLFETITFFNNSVTCAFETKNTKLMNSYSTLLNALKHSSKNENENDVFFKHMPALCFSNLVSSFEDYLLEMALIALKKQPLKMAKATCDLKMLLELSKDEIIEYKAREHLNTILYAKPLDYMRGICDLLGVKPDVIKNEWMEYIEIKARRDLGVHNRWIKNDTYIRKTKEAGITTVPDEYLKPDLNTYKAAFHTCSQLVAKITDEVLVNVYKQPPLIGDIFNKI